MQACRVKTMIKNEGATLKGSCSGEAMCLWIQDGSAITINPLKRSSIMTTRDTTQLSKNFKCNIF